jgi:hypothetical protein
MTDHRVSKMRIFFGVACAIFVSVSVPSWAAGDCTKGLLWPFMRSAGECLTQTEKAQGRIGVYDAAGEAQGNNNQLQNPPALQANKSTSPGEVSSGEKISATPVRAPAAVHAEPSVQIQAPDAAPASCQKGLLWPFVREQGDCPTDQDRKNAIER